MPEAEKAAHQLGGPVWVVKAQIHAGGRGKAGGVKVVKSIEDVAREMETIRKTDAPLVFPVVPSAHIDHIRYSFGMTRA